MSVWTLLFNYIGLAVGLWLSTACLKLAWILSFRRSDHRNPRRINRHAHT